MSSQASYPVEGEMIGPYRIERKLGGGGMGVVFAAVDVGLDRPAAIKVIAPHLADDPDFRARFSREARALAALDSAHVVQVYAYGEAGGRLYIATQLVPDGDLGAMLQTYGAPPLPTALDLIGQVASGLADAHAAGLIHRDIKPANVLLRRRDDSHQAYLGDFGVSRKADSETRTSSGVAGTPSYMAPELHTGAVAGVESDVYSLGCLLWATVSGSAPYRGTSDYEIVTSHFEQPIPQLDGTTPVVTETNRILRTAMAKQPGDRYPSAAALRDDLRRAQSSVGETIGAAGAESVGSTRSPRGRRGLGVVAGVAAVVVAGVAVAAFAFRGDGDPSSTPASTPTSSETPGETPSHPTTSSSPLTPVDGDEAKAVASLSAALEAQGLLTKAQADCTARHWVDEAGLQNMIDAGFFDASMEFHDQDQSKLSPELQSAALTATLACAGATP